MQVEESPLPRLLEEISSLNTKLHELSVQHYRQVVDARESLSRCAAAGTDLEAKVEQATSEALPLLRDRLSSFQDMGKKVLIQHKKTLSTIDLHAQLVDLLQIPQLMDTCARSGAIEEALELCSFARTLRTRHDAIAESVSSSRTGGEKGAGADIVRWVADEVEQSAGAMRRQLLQQLRGPVDLPTCLRLLSYLKRLDAQRRTFASSTTSIQKGKDESILRREFLEARDAFLQMQTLSAAERGDPPYQTTLKAIQKNREIWFDVITQYQAIFGMSADDDSSEILARWIGTKVLEFISRLKESLARFENCGELGTVYELSSSFAASLSRVGADFRPLLPPLFVKRARELMLAQWIPATTNAKDAFSNGEWGEALPTASSSATTGSKSDDLTPPLQFLQFPAVVDLVNSLLRSFNDLRSFACVNFVRDLATDLRAALENTVLGLETYNAAGVAKQQSQRFESLLDLMANKVLPYVARCFATVFEWKAVNQLLDINYLCDRLRAMMTSTPIVPVITKAASALSPMEQPSSLKVEQIAPSEVEQPSPAEVVQSQPRQQVEEPAMPVNDEAPDE